MHHRNNNVTVFIFLALVGSPYLLQVYSFSTSAPRYLSQAPSSLNKNVLEKHFSPPSSSISFQLEPSTLLISKRSSFPNEAIQGSSALKSVLNPAVLTASLGATGKLLSSIGIGVLVTPSGPKQFGRVLDDNSISALSKLTYWLFQPCFLMYGVAATLSATVSTSGGLPKSALMLLPSAALLQISLGALAAKLITTRRFGVRPALLGIKTDDEQGASDIRMCTTFANSGPLPLILSEAIFGRALFSDVSACVSLYLLMWSPVFWSLGGVILGTNEVEESSGEDGIFTKIAKKIKIFLSPPVVGSLLGVMIGSIELLRNILVKPDGILHPLFGAAKTFGVAYLPAAVLVLAGSLAGAKKSNENSADESTLHPKTILSILGSRFVLSPILAFFTVRFLSLAKLLPVDNVRARSIITFVLLMEGCMPPAQNSVILLQLAEKKERAANMAKMLTVIYALSVVPITFLMSGCLSLSGILNFI